MADKVNPLPGETAPEYLARVKQSVPIEGEVITPKSSEQYGKELGVTLANLVKGIEAIGQSFKQGMVETRLEKFTVEGVIRRYGVDGHEWADIHNGVLQLNLNGILLNDVGEGKRVRVTIEVL